MPFPLDQGRWIFVATFGQLVTMTIAAAVLVAAREDPLTFTALKIIAVFGTQCTALLLVFLPKMALVWKHYDFHPRAVAAYLQKHLTDSLQTDHVADMLSVSRQRDNSYGGDVYKFGHRGPPSLPEEVVVEVEDDPPSTSDSMSETASTMSESSSSSDTDAVRRCPTDTMSIEMTDMDPGEK